MLNQLVGVYTDVYQRSLELEQHGHQKDHQQQQEQGEEGLVDGSAKVLNALVGLDEENNDLGFQEHGHSIQVAGQQFTHAEVC